jgi:hypothetical protein
MCKSTMDYSLANFAGFVKYDPESRTGLTWLSTGRGKQSGKPAGCTIIKEGKRQEVSLTLFGKSYRVHRIIWVLLNGSLDPTKVIDHIDGNPWNNTASNLRAVTPADNLRNKAISPKNTSGITGVYFTKANGTSSYVASVSSESGNVGKNKRSFSIFKYGEEQAKQLAVEWRKQKLLDLEQQGIFYTERHGT